MALHVTRSSGSPVDPPTLEGQHWVNTTTGQHYLSKGTASVADWVQINSITTSTIDTDVEIFEDFTSDTNTGSLAWTVDTTGTAASAQTSNFGVNNVERAIGVLEIDTGTTVNGRTTLHQSFLSTSFGYALFDMKARVALSNLSDATHRFEATLGWMDSNAASPSHNNGVYFKYQDDVSANWQIVTANGGTRTTTTTTVAAGANTFDRFRITVNAAATLATFYINDVSVGTITTNIPTVNNCGLGFKIGKLVGTAASRSMYIDYVSRRLTYSAAR